MRGISIVRSRPCHPSILGVVLMASTLVTILAAPGRSVSIPEIPLTFRTPVAARYAGMGGASIAFADDHAALLSNPATLGLLRSIEFAAGFDRQSGEMDVRYLDDQRTIDFGKTRLSHLGFAYPFPTYRGSLVVGFSYGRVVGLDSGYLRRGSSGQVADREMILEDGGLGAYSAGAALEVSPNLTLGITGTILGGNSHRESTTQYDDSGYFESGSLITDADFHGITGSLGALVNLGSGLRMGLVLHLPEGIDGDVSVDDQFASSDTTYSDSYGSSDRIDLPFRLGAGLAYARPNLILAADAIYADWTQIDYGGPLRTSEGLDAYRETLALRLGGELLLSTQVPLRLRAGYAYEPLPYNVVLTETEIGPFHPTAIREARYESAVFQRDRQYLTVGAGVLLAESFTVDAAYIHGGFKRTGSESPSSVYQEEQKDRRVFVSLTMRLR